MIREDGRSTDGLRALSCELGVLTSTDGSARFRAGLTSALASVHGPRPAQSARFEDAERARLEVHVAPAAGAAGAREAELAVFLRQALAPLIVLTASPRAVITVGVHVQSDDGGAAAVAFNAAVLALADAGVPLRAIAGAVALARASDGGLLVDPTRDEVCGRAGAGAPARATLTAAFDEVNANAGDAPIAMFAAGARRRGSLTSDLRAAAAASVRVISFSRAVLAGKVQRDAVNCAPEVRAALAGAARASADMTDE